DRNRRERHAGRAGHCRRGRPSHHIPAFRPLGAGGDREGVAMSSYAPVTSVMRSLELLAILNRQRISTIEHMHRLTSLPKPTIVRLLETLMAAGYVARDVRGKGYQVTSQVNALSCGF